MKQARYYAIASLSLLVLVFILGAFNFKPVRQQTEHRHAHIQPQIPDMSYDQILLLGDSLTEFSFRPNGWGLKLSSLYNRKADVKVRAVAGYNSWNLRFAMPPILNEVPKDRVRLITILIGTNDFSLESDHQHVPLDQYKENLEAILREIQLSVPAAKVVVMTPPPIGMAIREGRHTYTIKRVQKPEWNPSSIQKYFYDNLHFGDEGSNVLYEALSKFIAAQWPELNPENMPFKYPYPDDFLSPCLLKMFQEARQPTNTSLITNQTAKNSTMQKQELGYNQILLLGDSLTESGASDKYGWGHQLIHRYSRKMTVDIFGFGGYNSYWLKIATPHLLASHLSPSRLQLATLLIGTNDSYVAEIVHQIRAFAPDVRILVLTPPPMSVKEVWGLYAFESVKVYREACMDVFRKLEADIGGDRIAMLDTWDLLIGKNETYLDASFDPSLLKGLLYDGVHFSEDGHNRLFAGVVETVESKWPELAPTNLPYRLPLDDYGPFEEAGDEDAVRKWLFGTST
ncbi:SGNH hydrolase [Rhizoclosmatium globosum]|uniref:SGNH hydrolase n=1 Tax=Rhizoclosmatium globosum TaxID=329046 RepID=A0A1Y2CAT4_9FUNG|nr:SGNH hydrolase [Rhizoclosmatium globosum]|eukprot:ORY44046.1 SGNH hydrolase [Rhizoclosmatium globosum]